MSRLAWLRLALRADELQAMLAALRPSSALESQANPLRIKRRERMAWAQGARGDGLALVHLADLAQALAARVPARMLVLETPFDNIRGLMASHLRREVLPFEPAFRFPNDRHLDMADLPVLIFHGTRDRVVPFASAAKLKQFLNPGDEFVTIEGGAHNNLGKFPLYRERLANWLMSRG